MGNANEVGVALSQPPGREHRRGEGRRDGRGRRADRRHFQTTTTKVPWLGDIPVLGWAFKTTDTSAAQDEPAGVPDAPHRAHPARSRARDDPQARGVPGPDAGTSSTLDQDERSTRRRALRRAAHRGGHALPAGEPARPRAHPRGRPLGAVPARAHAPRSSGRAATRARAARGGAGRGARRPRRTTSRRPSSATPTRPRRCSPT